MSVSRLEPARPEKHRLHALCPYFAMFPETFARQNILATTRKGDIVFDPFSGRGTTLLESLLNEREAIACDINPVAAVVSSAKAAPPSLARLISRLDELQEKFEKTAHKKIDSEAAALPTFFAYAFDWQTLRQILFIRRHLAWRTSKRDEFIAATLLGHLHGESDRSPSCLSAQMPHTIAPKPYYAVSFWKKHRTVPPTRDVFSLLKGKIEYRLEKGVPDRRGKVARCDARHASSRFRKEKGKVAAIITSPPYLNVTSFEEDQWLRLWFLGGDPWPTYSQVSRDDRHRSVDNYFTFLKEVWGWHRAADEKECLPRLPHRHA